MIAGLSLLPSTAVLEMTYRCNHKCLFCSCPWYAGKLPVRRELDIAEWKELIETYCDLGVTHFTFTGGEAILKDGLCELIEFTAACRARHAEETPDGFREYFAPPTMNLLSNGRELTEDIIRLCAKHQMNLSISLPGLTTFQRNTDSDTKPEHILELFGKTRKLHCPGTVGIAVTKLNFPELYETIAAALLAGADTLLLNRFMPGGRGLSHLKELSLTREEVVSIAHTAEKVLTLAKRTGHFGTELPRCLIDPTPFRMLQISTGCSAVRNFFTVGPGGWLRTCNHSPGSCCPGTITQNSQKMPTGWLMCAAKTCRRTVMAVRTAVYVPEAVGKRRAP